VTSDFGQALSMSLTHHISELHTYRAYSFLYITLGWKTIFLAFSRSGVSVLGDGAEVQRI
jgi:hypothetical protein